MTRPTMVLDSGAVIALARADRRAQIEVQAADESGTRIIVPAVVVAETVRDSASDAPVNRVLKAIGAVAPCDERTGRVAGGLLARARSKATIDALVVATAVELGGAVIVTGDPDDLNALAADHPEVVIRAL